MEGRSRTSRVDLSDATKDLYFPDILVSNISHNEQELLQRQTSRTASRADSGSKGLTESKQHMKECWEVESNIKRLMNGEVTRHRQVHFEKPQGAATV